MVRGDAEQVKAPTMSRIVASLLQAELVHRRTDTQDRRAVVIQATKKGIRMMQEGRRRRVAALAAAVRGLAEKEIVQLLQAAQVMERLSRQV
jgi:DNA-binding MarR family transcriptional regulator